MENHPHCSVKTLMYAKVLLECLRHDFVSILNMSFGKITHNLIVYLDYYLRSKCTQKYTSHYDHCNVLRAWTWGLLCTVCVDVRIRDPVSSPF